MPAAGAIHTLEGEGLRQWQAFFKKGPFALLAKPVIVIPVVVGFSLLSKGENSHAHGSPVPFFCVLVCAWLFLCFLAFMVVRLHLRNAVKARVAPDGLYVEALWSKRRVPWGLIKDFYLVDNKTFTVQLRNDERLFLSHQMSDCKALAQKIEQYLPHRDDSYLLNSAAAAEVQLSQTIAFAAIWLASVFALIKSVFYSPSILSLKSLTDIVLAVGLTTIMYMAWKAMRRADVQQIRIGRDCIAIIADEKEVRLDWHDIRSFKKLGGVYLMFHRKGFSFIIPKLFASAERVENALRFRKAA